MCSFTNFCGAFLTILTLMQTATGYIIPSETEPDCPDIECTEFGSLITDTCTCACDNEHTGFLCETELQHTAWPHGRYSLLSSVFGCPESDEYGWHRGYINLTLPDSRPVQKWKMPFIYDDAVQNSPDPHLLGPYFFHALQLNFCTRLDKDVSTDSVPATEKWPGGNYCVFNAGDSCPNGFSENSVTIAGYHVTWSDTDGVLPNVTLDNNSSTLTLTYCCREGDGGNNDTLNLPNDFPFLLLKKNGSDCSPVNQMEVSEERFDMVDDLGLFQFEGQDSIFGQFGEHQRLGLCYYATTTVQECVHPWDHSYSYLGTVNVTKDGLPCMNWYDKDPEYKPGKHWVGDGYTQNHCRYPVWTTDVHVPFCYVNATNGTFERHLCNIPECEMDPMLEDVGTFKPVYGSPHMDDRAPENAVNGIELGFPFQAQRPRLQPWLQIDLEEAFLVHGVKIRRRYIWFPVNFRFVAVHVSQQRWDFINYGALQCNERRNPRKSRYYQLMCIRPIHGQYVTIRNFDDSDPESNWGKFFFLEISEVLVIVKRSVCVRRLGLLSGEVRDFQLSGSGDAKETMFDRGRLLIPGSGWCVDKVEDPYFMVDLIVPTVVSGLEIQGWMDGQNVINVEDFLLELGVNQEALQPFLDPQGHTKIFRIDAELSPSMVKRIIFMQSRLTRYLRLNITKYSGHPCLKLELLGCPKRASRDLFCGAGTQFFGYEVMSRSTFWMETDELLDVNQTTCSQLCSSRQDCLCHFFKPGTCTLFKSTRYNPHYYHWFVSKLEKYDRLFAKLCIEDIKDTRICGGTIVEATMLESPSYPFYYGQMLNCTWKINFTTRRAYARIEIKEVNLAPADTLAGLRQSGVFDISPGQCVDTLTIDGVTITSENEYEYRRSVIVSRDAKTEIVLTSCTRYSLADVRGFRLDISYSESPGCRSSEMDCMAMCKPPAAIITSPAYPTGLKPATACRWTIRGELGQFVSLTFKVVDIRSSTRTCETSYVGVVDGSLFGVWTAVGQYCSYDIPIGEVRSSWQFMELLLVVGDGAAGNGFIAEYTLVDYVKQTKNSTSNDIAGCMDWQEYEDNCYQVFEEPEGLTWIAAEGICQDNYGHLVSLASPQEASFLHSLLTTELLHKNITDPTLYIGLQKIGVGERYVNYQWADGSPLTYTAWFRNETSGQSQPDGLENERCTQLSLYSIHSLRNWHDVACAYDKTRLFICEKSRLTFDVGWKHLEFVLPWQPRISNASQSLNLFTCNEHAILAMYLCDGHEDCADGSDERMCEKACVHGFTCDNGQCITAARYCDFRKDCDDGSDESQCVLAECLQSEWTCSSGQCISKDFRCDVKADCFDGSDEENCATCQPSSFQCYDQRCVASSRVCDTYSDCSGRFNEDESQGCSSSSQGSCSDWYTIGMRESGSYYINLGTQDSFEVECQFTETGDNRVLVQTILHHEFESIMTWISGIINVQPRYSAGPEQITNLKNRSTVCKQFFALDCSYITTNAFTVHGNAGMKLDSFMVNSECGCPYVGNCGENIEKCNCSAVEHNEWYGNDHNIFRTDSGYITNQQFLPVQRLKSLELGTSFSPVYRTTLGPFICEEEIIGSGISDTMVCDNNQLANKDTKCILDFDDFGEIKGCRDLSHIETCDNISCPEYHARCPDGHCLPFYRICDGIKQCSGGEDEMYCDSNTACVGNLKCRESYVCVPMINVCDGVPHCPLGDDERFCNEACIDGCSCNEDSMICTISVFTNVSESHSFERLRSLRQLFLESSFDYIEFNASAFYHFPYLIHFDMSGSRIKLLSPYQFEKNRNLLTLDISDNLISVLYAHTFYGLGKLKTLRLIGNPLSEIQPYAFSGLDRLPGLDLVGFSIKDLTVGIFDGLSMLKMLNMSSSRLLSVESYAFADLKALTSLDLRDNGIKDFDKGIFEGLLILKDLYTSDFTFCCLRPESVKEENCLPSKDEFSSCDDLMRNQVLRAFLWIIGGLALLGNIGVLIYRFVVDRQSLSKTYGVFVTNLGMADFLMGVYLMILAIADTEFRGSYVWNDYHWRNGTACKIAGILSTLGSECSVIFLCFITLDRLLVVKFPFGNVRISRKVCIALCFCAWLFILTLALVPLKTGDYFQGTFYSRSAVCLALPLTRDRPAGWEYSIAVFIVFNLSAFILIAIAQIIIYREIVVSGGKLASKGRRNDMTVARNLFLVAITDFMCWFPVGVMGVMALSDHVISGEVYAWIAVFVLPINSALNPFIYTIGATISKARTTRRSTMRKSVSKGSSDITKVFTNRSLHFGRKKMADKQTVIDLTLRRAVTIKETFFVALRLAKSIHTIHSVDLIHGNLSKDKVYLKDSPKGICNVAVMITPKLCQTEEDLTNDIKAYGEVIKHMLKSVNAGLPKTSCYVVSKQDLVMCKKRILRSDIGFYLING